MIVFVIFFDSDYIKDKNVFDGIIKKWLYEWWFGCVCYIERCLWYVILKYFFMRYIYIKMVLNREVYINEYMFLFWIVNVVF